MAWLVGCAWGAGSVLLILYLSSLYEQRRVRRYRTILRRRRACIDCGCAANHYDIEGQPYCEDCWNEHINYLFHTN